MANELDYLNLVLPDDGPFVFLKIAGFDKKTQRKRQLYPDTKEALAQLITRNDAPENTLYVGLAAIHEAGNRRTENIARFKALFLDIDCGIKQGKIQAYPEQKAAILALKSFCGRSKFPIPTVVNSGYGIHCYWVMSEDISVSEWREAQFLLGRLAEYYGFHVDKQALTNVTQAPRPVGSKNNKPDMEAKEVKFVKAQAKTFKPNILLGALRNFAQRENVQVPVAKPPLSDIDLNKLESIPHTPAQYDIIEERCGQVKHFLTRQNQDSYMGWLLKLGIASFCAFPEQTAIRWSAGHQAYTERETLLKLKSLKGGPPLCKTMELHGAPGICEQCEFRDRIVTPVQLGVQHKPIEDDFIPRGYKRSRENGIIRVIDHIEEVITPYNVWVSDYYWDDREQIEYVTINWNSLNPYDERVYTQTMPSYLITPGNSQLPDTFGKMGISATGGIAELKGIAMYLTEYKRKLEKARARPMMYSSMGWHENFKVFVLGNHIYRFSKEKIIVNEVTLSKGNSDVVKASLHPEGNFNEWIDAIRLLDHRGMELFGAAALMGFGSILMPFTTLSGLAGNMVGPSGAGKSLTGRIILSAFGNADPLFIHPYFTQNAITARFATHNNLPIYVDELTNQKGDWLSDFIYKASFGIERSRLNRDATEMAQKSWQSIVWCSSNTSFSDRLMKERANPEAELMRLIEFHVDQSAAIEAKEGKRVALTLAKNYGLFGPRLVHALLPVTHKLPYLIQEELPEALETKMNMKFSGKERFAEAAFTVALMTGIVLDKMKVDAFDWRRCLTAGYEHYRGHRSLAEEHKFSAVTAINEFCASHYGQIAIFTKRHSSDIVENEHRLVGQKIVGMIQKVNVKGGPLKPIRLNISVRAFRDYMADQAIPLAKFYKELRGMRVLESKSKRIKLHPDMGPLECIVIGLDNKHFEEGFLETFTTEQTDDSVQEERHDSGD